jgi:hypothetical protein
VGDTREKMPVETALSVQTQRQVKYSKSKTLMQRSGVWIAENFDDGDSDSS